MQPSLTRNELCHVRDYILIYIIVQYFLEKQLISKKFCFIFLTINQNTFLQHLSSGIYAKDLLSKALKV